MGLFDSMELHILDLFLFSQIVETLIFYIYHILGASEPNPSYASSSNFYLRAIYIDFNDVIC
jgi:hypothetical protein